MQQLSTQASESAQRACELHEQLALQTTMLADAKADTQRWLQDSVRRTREAQHQREAAAAAQQALAVAVQQNYYAQAKIDVMSATQRQLYDSQALRAARRRRGARNTREDTISDVRDRAAFAVLCTMLVFDSSDAMLSIAAAETQCEQEAATARATQEAQDAAVAAALGAAASRDDTISDVRDRAAFAVLSTLLPFSQRDAVVAIAAAEQQCKQEAAAAKAAQEAQDKAVAAALTTAYAAQDAAVATAVAWAQLRSLITKPHRQQQ